MVVFQIVSVLFELNTSQSETFRLAISSYYHQLLVDRRNQISNKAKSLKAAPQCILTTAL